MSTPGKAKGEAGVQLRVRGMTCANCARKVGDALRGVEGVGRVEVNLETGVVWVHGLGSGPRGGELARQAVEGAGFDASVELVGANEKGGRRFPLGWRDNALGAGVGGVVLWGLSHSTTLESVWLSLAVGLLVQVVCGARFYQGAWLQARRGMASMDTLVALGSSAAFGYSAVMVAGWGAKPHVHLFFSEAAGILAFISLGHWLESRAAEKAKSALRSLMELAPHKARVLNEDGSERDLPVAELSPGMRIRVRAGERFPSDAEIVEGWTEVDESMLTGESLPRARKEGGRVTGGTVNGPGVVVCRVTSTGADTVLARIIAAVERSQASRASVQRLVDRISQIFVPSVVVLAVGVMLAWGWWPEAMAGAASRLEPMFWPRTEAGGGWMTGWVYACAVLIVACPCAMGLATPAAIMAGTNVGVRHGILLRDARAIENAGRIRVVLFDKTGTLTVGKPAPVSWHDASVGLTGEMVEADGESPDWLNRAKALAAHSKHPLSRALTDGSGGDGAAGGGARKGGSGLEPMEFWNVRELAGRGVEGISAERPEEVWRWGSPAWLGEEGVDITAWKQVEGAGDRTDRAVAAFARGIRLEGWVEFQDCLKPGVPEMVEQFKRRGYEVGLVSGDRRGVVERLAASAGFERAWVVAEARPEQKSDWIRHWQERGHPVAFVGDGLNDGPALAQATLGIAVSQASDLAKESADIVLLGADAGLAPDALELSGYVLRVIRQNLVWAFAYNVLAAPLAALGFLSPVVCAAAMGLSDLMVMGNSLRLLRWSPRRAGQVR